MPGQQLLVVGPLLLGRLAPADQDPVLQVRQAPGTALHRPDELRLGDDHLGLGVAQDVLPLLFREAVVERQEDRAEPVGRVDQLQELRLVVEQQTDDITASDAQFGQAGRQLVDPLVKVTDRQTALVLDDGDGVRPLRQVVIEDAREIVHGSLSLCGVRH